MYIYIYMYICIYIHIIVYYIIYAAGHELPPRGSRGCAGRVRQRGCHVKKFDGRGCQGKKLNRRGCHVKNRC